MAIHSQLLNCSASEVAAMIEGVMRHGTSMTVEGNYVDSHGQSEIGFAISSLLGFKLLPRIKQINRVKLYGSDRDSKEHYHLLAPAMTRPTRWELIEQPPSAHAGRRPRAGRREKPPPAHPRRLLLTFRIDYVLQHII